MKNLCRVLLALCFLLSSLSRADAPIVEVEIADDSWVEVPLDFTFPFYGNSYVTSFMFSNGVVGFLEPNPQDWGLCCDGQDLEKFTGSKFNYTIMPWHTDLININGQGHFYTQGDSTYQKYMWKDISEYYNQDTKNTFDLTIFPLGNIEINYEQVHVKDHGITVAIVGDLSAGEYEQWFYNAPNQNGAVYWDSQQADPVEIQNGESICSVVPNSHLTCLYYPETYADAYYEQQCNLNPLYDNGCDGYSEAYINQQCTLDSLWSMACPNFETAYINQQCEFNPIYSVYCSGYEDAVKEKEEEEEKIEFAIPTPESYIEINLPMLNDYSINLETITNELPEITFDEIVEQEMILEIEAEIETLFEPVLETEEIEEPIEDIVEEPVEEENDEPIENESLEDEPVEDEPIENESGSEDERAEEELEEVKEVMIAKVEPVKKTKKQSKKDKMKEIIVNKLNELAKEMGNAVSLEEQKNLQSYILALLNYNQGFNNYNTSLVDGIFYSDKDIYTGKQIPDNKNGLRNGLANEILHNKLVDLQWQN